PSMVIMAAVGGEDLGPMIDTALSGDRPAAIRFPRSTLPTMPAELRVSEGPIEGARWLKRASSPRLTIVAIGPPALAALAAASHARSWSVLDARFASPLDRRALAEAAAAGCVLTVEESSAAGGFGSAVLELLAEQGLRVSARCLGLPARFVRHGDARLQRVELGLDAAGIRRAAEQLVGDR